MTSGTRVTGGGECAIIVAVGVQSNLQRRLLGAILALLADDRLDTGHATDSDSRGLTDFDYERLASSCFELRSSASLTTPLTWRRPPSGCLKSDWPSG